jgi:ABC-type lipoprotein export system ATPase subunit
LLAVTGPSGCGKTTMLNLLAGLDQPTQGIITFDGEAAPSPERWTELRAERIGISFQDFNLLPTLTARENVEIAMFGTRMAPAERARRAASLLAAVGIAHCAGRMPRELSGGERRRVAVARALANEPALLLADEPTSNLDSASGAEIADLLLSIHATRGATMVLITHSESLASRCQRLVRMLDGRIVADQRKAEAAP